MEKPIGLTPAHVIVIALGILVGHLIAIKLGLV